MALFGKKKAVEAKVEEEVTTKKVAATKTTKAKTAAPKKAKTVSTDTAVKAVKEETKTVGKNPYSYRITEKATTLADKNVYVLNIPKTENKTELKKTLEAKYKVTVLKINIVNSPKKEKVSRGRYGMRGGGKKAYVTLKAGDSIVL
jgi:large subunit ribosomal protein L23